MIGAKDVDKGTIASSSPKLAFGIGLPDRKRLRKKASDPRQKVLFPAAMKRTRRSPSLPPEDNTPEGLRALLRANVHYRQLIGAAIDRKDRVLNVQNKRRGVGSPIST
jgi:hypothetical protein